MSLLNETKEKLKDLGLSLKDIKWFGSTNYGYSSDIKLFERLANKDYDSGFGAQKVARDLVIVGKDFWFDRGEYDGSEWWEEHSKHSMPKKPKKKIAFKGLIITKETQSRGGSCGWESLEDIDNKS